MRTATWTKSGGARKRRSLRGSLLRAVEDREFLLRYQPIVRLESGMISGFEALLRWRHPAHGGASRGEAAPPEFMPAVERAGLGFRIEFLALREACRRMSRWREMFPDHRPLVVNVNLSGFHLEWPGLYGRIERVLDESGLDGRCLRLEFSEGAVMKDVKSAIESFEQLRELGVRVQLDRFGTGYSSLGVLHRLPLDALKIDGSFISPANEGSLEVARTITTLAHQLGIDTVACGVETTGQVSLLREMGCDYAQGDRFARPVKSEVVEAMLRAEPRW